mgnify:CR=1 FL=1
MQKGVMAFQPLLIEMKKKKTTKKTKIWEIKQVDKQTEENKICLLHFCVFAHVKRGLNWNIPPQFFFLKNFCIRAFVLFVAISVSLW